ncbi:hypothetical protein F4678DRAFT_197065 [Xylaria arbuscula]|nr:hypothetical protein F4678DRAFT_197065 [Xylaria arbuscula]
MMYPSEVQEVVGLACIVVFGIIATSLSIWARMAARSSDVKAQTAKSIEEALKKLYTVTEKKSQHDYRKIDDDAECPICLSTFSKKSQENLKTRDGEVDIESGQGPPKMTTIMAMLAASMKWIRRHSIPPPIDDPIDDEILAINRCGHAFHSRCLVAWFTKKKYDCPICRARYYPPPKPKPKWTMQGAEEDLRAGMGPGTGSSTIPTLAILY